MSCNNKTIYISKILTIGDIVELVPNRTLKKENLGDLCTYEMIIGCGLECIDSFPVVLATDEAKIPLYTKYGNTLYFNQIRKNRYRYCIGYGNNNVDLPDGQFVVFNPLCLPSPTTPAPVLFNKKKKKGEDEE